MPPSPFFNALPCTSLPPFAKPRLRYSSLSKHLLMRGFSKPLWHQSTITKSSWTAALCYLYDILMASLCLRYRRIARRAPMILVLPLELLAPLVLLLVSLLLVLLLLQHLTQKRLHAWPDSSKTPRPRVVTKVIVKINDVGHTIDDSVKKPIQSATCWPKHATRNTLQCCSARRYVVRVQFYIGHCSYHPSSIRQYCFVCPNP